jgi:hypothetical protein
MVSHFFSSALLLVVVLLLIDTPSVAASRDRRIIPRVRHHQLANRLPRAVEQPAPSTRLRRRRSCRNPPTNTSSSASVPKPSPAEPPNTIQDAPAAVPSSNANVGTGGGDSGGDKPSNWPTVTQRGAVPAATRTSPADPYLRSLSQALDNSENSLFTDVHKGQMTY